MKTNSHGFILLTTLLMMMVMSLLLLTAMQQILLYAKALRIEDAAHNKFYQLESMTHQLVAKGACVKPAFDVNAILSYVANRGCIVQEGKHKYRYIIEDLGNFDCLMVKVKKNMQATNHRRITVMLDEKAPRRFLQLRIITQASQASACEGEWYAIKEGVSSWRYGVY
jgi:hypothetical protein